MSNASHPEKAAPHSGATVRAEVRLPVRLNDGNEAVAVLFTFYGLADGKEHIALKFGKPGARPLVRLHSECLTGDVFGSLRCDCGPQLQEALGLLHSEGGYLLYLRQEGRGIGLYSKLDAYRLQENGRDTFAADRELGHHSIDSRDYTSAAQMLHAMGITRIELLSNNPDKSLQLGRHGIQVECRRTGVYANPHNLAYLQAKVDQTNHALPMGLPFINHPNSCEC
ncbi:GTP cyclohydrolase II RibA [Achromobacter spanius]|uniref:GTP cyclohydrolase II RibA n=1 Tax=Achromobacter spanius TaxID=217203 RepID=UPI003A9205EA